MKEEPLLRETRLPRHEALGCTSDELWERALRTYRAGPDTRGQALGRRPRPAGLEAREQLVWSRHQGSIPS